MGTFNGDGHTIRNLVIRAKTEKNEAWDWAGLFGRIDAGGVVRDLKIEAADVETVDCHVGILAGENASRVVNCQVNGRVSSSSGDLRQEEVGGLVGRNTGDIIDCRAGHGLGEG